MRYSRQMEFTARVMILPFWLLAIFSFAGQAGPLPGVEDKRLDWQFHRWSYEVFWHEGIRVELDGVSKAVDRNAPAVVYSGSGDWLVACFTADVICSLYQRDAQIYVGNSVEYRSGNHQEAVQLLLRRFYSQASASSSIRLKSLREVIPSYEELSKASPARPEVAKALDARLRCGSKSEKCWRVLLIPKIAVEYLPIPVSLQCKCEEKPEVTYVMMPVLLNGRLHIGATSGVRDPKRKAQLHDKILKVLWARVED